ncbi:Fc receptor-like protein 5 isoform X2 [Arapaima gigas]
MVPSSSLNQQYFLPAHSLSQKPVLTGPTLSYLGSQVVFRCEASVARPPVVYELLKEEHIVANRTPTEMGQPATFKLLVTLQDTYLVTDPNPPVVYEGQRLELSCKVQNGSHLTYQWHFNRMELSHRGSELDITQVTEHNAGNYFCSAMNDIENPRISYSSEIHVVVRGMVDLDELLMDSGHKLLSLTVSKNDSGYQADVMCWSDRGSPPVSFWLLLNETTVESRETTTLSARFSVPLRLEVNYGKLQCWMENDVQKLSSDTMMLEVVTVLGRVQLQLDYLYDTSFTTVAALLQCTTRGTFPEFAWFQNNTPLGDKGDSHVITNQGRSLILTSLSARNSGYYHCKAKDSFDNSSWAASQAILVQVTGSFGVSIETIAILLSCFLLLVIVGTVCFVVFRLNKVCLLQTAKVPGGMRFTASMMDHYQPVQSFSLLCVPF